MPPGLKKYWKHWPASIPSSTYSILKMKRKTRHVRQLLAERMRARHSHLSFSESADAHQIDRK